MNSPVLKPERVAVFLDAAAMGLVELHLVRAAIQ
jgi:hypothetical protein